MIKSFSLQARSPFGGYREKYTHERHARGDTKAGGEGGGGGGGGEIGNLARRLDIHWCLMVI